MPAKLLKLLSIAGKGERRWLLKQIQMDLMTSGIGFAEKGFFTAARTKKGKSTMGTLYFLLPIVGTVALIALIIARINARSYVHRRVEATFTGRLKKETDQGLCPKERLEQRYVDWYTREEEGRARKREEKDNEENLLVGTAYMTGGMAYRPESNMRRMTG